ncbi:MAG: hypothetical protein ABII93_08560 [Chrysiogenia bacterium]
MKKQIYFLLLAFSLTLFAFGEMVLVPGEVNSLCYYDNFFYNLPEHDFLFYFNDALQYAEPPDDSVYNGGRRDKYLKLAERHRQVKEFVDAFGNKQNFTLSLSLNNEQGFDQAVKFMDLLGLKLKKASSGSLEIKPPGDEAQTNYYLFCRLKASSLEKQLNQTGKFFFKLPETAVPMPWDYGFLSAISGLDINADNFFEHLIANKRFSFLLSILFRLSKKEVDFIDRTLPKAPVSAWKSIYQDRKLLMGMLVLSKALRVRDGRLFIPGGDQARKFWSALVGIDPDRAPFDFLTRLSGMDHGKMNYLYVFSYFLPEETRRVMFFDYNQTKVRRLYQKISLGANERIKANSFPRLENFTYYSLMHVLKIKDGRIDLSPGLKSWSQAMDLELPAAADECDFLESLLAAAANNGKKISLLQKFMSVYSKFSGRQLIFNQNFLSKVFAEFESKSTLLDFVEKIPLKESASVDALFAWQESLQKLNSKERPLFSALGQSLLETIARAAGFSANQGDFDKVTRELLEIPLQRPAFYDGIFAFIKNQCRQRSFTQVSRESLFDFLLAGLKNQVVDIRGERFEWRVREMAAAELGEILNSQELCSLSALSDINAMLSELAEDPDRFSSQSGRRLLDAFEQLPYPAFSKAAPKNIRERVIAYDKSDLGRDVQALLKKIARKADRAEIKKAIDELKGNYLLPNLKDFFLSLAYALNAGNPKLRIFMNPNIARLHDFSENGGTPWSHNSSPGNKADFSGYYLQGGLSRLHLTFSLNWRNQLFEKSIYNAEQNMGMLYNIMALLPQPQASLSAAFDALLVEFAVELLQQCPGDEELKIAVGDAFMTQTCGYHYRRLNDFLSGHSADYYLFMSELRKIGLYLFNGEFQPDKFSKSAELGRYARLPLRAAIENESDLWGNIHYSFSGSLSPRADALLPQEVALLFASGWTAGELINEYRIKTAYLANKNDLPTCLLGQFVFDYINTVCKSVYAQNHVKDYYSIFFVFDIMNSGHLKNTVKKLQKKGFLRLL